MASDPFNPYKELYDNPKGQGDSRPGALQIVSDNNRVGQWSGRSVLITGATSGIGLETARALRATGADVYITARDLDKARSVINDVLYKSLGTGKLTVIEMDMESLDSVKKAAAQFLIKSGNKINVLINNAGMFNKRMRSMTDADNCPGVMATPEGKTMDGIETQFAVNHAAHFALTALLLPSLVASSTADFNSRVIFVSSSSHRYCPFNWDNINLEGEYDPFLAYGRAKTAEIWTSNYIDRVYGPLGVHSLSVHPGGIFTGLQKHVTAEKAKGWDDDEELLLEMQSPAQGAATTVWAAVGTVWEGKGGKYLAECSISPPSTMEDQMSALDNGHAPWIYDVQSENRLWDLSIQLTDVSPP